MAQKHQVEREILRPRSWPECNVFPALPQIYVTDAEVQTDNIICDHDKENNRHVMNKLKVLSQHLLDYNKRTFEKFMRDVKEEYRERVSANKKMRCEIEDLKMQVQEAEKKLASARSNPIC